MFKQATTFVIGAGASCEIGLPSGYDLKGEIATLLAPANNNAYGFVDGDMQTAIKTVVGGDIYSGNAAVSSYQAAAARISRSLPLALSIDNLLHSHQDDSYLVRLGKLAIAICITRAEQRSLLFELEPNYPNRGPRLRQRQLITTGANLSKTWYPSLARMLFAGVQRTNIAQAFENVRFVIFNYDRCLEQYLSIAMQAYFDIDEPAAAAVLEGAEFIHPYGSLGRLPWQTGNTRLLPLGGGHGVDYWHVGDQLKTFTETANSSIRREIAEATQVADTIIFLGFGYLAQNLELLNPGDRRPASRALSTSCGISDADREIIKLAMMKLGRQDYGQSFVDPGTCSDLFANYHLMLSAA